MGTLQGYFKKYLSNIQPTRANRALAIQHQQTVREKLRADTEFSEWYKDDFLYGSYKRYTAVQPIKDVDICILLDIDPADLNDPHTDSENAAYEPHNVIEYLRSVLDRLGYKGKTNFQRRSIRIDFADGMTLDIVPVVEVSGPDKPLKIPDRTLDEWIDTHPKGHLRSATDLNKESGGLYIPFVKLVKAWYRYQMRLVERPKPKGFTLEAMVAVYWDSDAPSYADAFITFLQNVNQKSGVMLARGTFPAVPDPGRPGQCLGLNISAQEAKDFGRLISETLVLAKAARDMNDEARSAARWKEIFGPKFPTPEAMSNSRAAAVSKSITQPDEDADDETLIERDLYNRAAVPGRVRITAQLSRTADGPLGDYYPNDGDPLQKGWHLTFKVADMNVQKPYAVVWTVENHGAEAREADRAGKSRLVYTENTGTVEHTQRHTEYRGSHYMICELKRDDQVLARTRFRVNVGHTRI